MTYRRCCIICVLFVFFFFFKQKTAYEMRISDWSSDVCSSDLSGVSDESSGCSEDFRSVRNSDALPRLCDGRQDHTVKPHVHIPLKEIVANERPNGGPVDRDQQPDHLGRGRFTVATHLDPSPDRKSVVEGKRVSVRVDIGGRRS